MPLACQRYRMLARGMERQFRPPFFRQTQIDRRSRQIRQIAAMDDTELLQYANQGQKAIERYSTKRWNEEMKQIEEYK